MNVPQPARWLRFDGTLVRFTDRDDGDLGHGGAWVELDEIDPEVQARRNRVLPAPWSWVRQVHGADVVTVDRPGGGAGEVADASVAAGAGAALVVLTADCAPIALIGDNDSYGAVHAGWRGLMAGVVERAADGMRDLGATSVRAALGPCVHAECYEFSRADLDTVAARFGDAVRGETSSGRDALDLVAAVRAALANAGVALVHDEDVCTACSPRHFSHRARGEKERQALVVYRPE